jgi:membrane-associated phospholipid phosphatase
MNQPVNQPVNQSQNQPVNPLKTPPMIWHLPGGVLALVVTFWVLHGKDQDTLLLEMARHASREINDIFLTLGSLTLLFIAWRTRSKQYLKKVLAVMLGQTLIHLLIKGITFNLLHVLPRPSGGSAGFPSGHSSASFALAFLLTERFPRGSVVWYMIAALISWSRLDQGAHYAYQIIGGMLLGGVCAVVGTKKIPADLTGKPSEREGIAER